ncbi:MAG: SMP-30/gluconolactonase/LRE family protein [Myxococcales bacterium]|nr:SMP-30/gluconolactonase/LRE family protein [Myxococcales bacterium]
MSVETLAWGYGLVEGPRVDPEGRLYFSDVRQGGVYCRDPSGEIETVVPRRRGVGGIALHADGGLVISGRNVCHVRDGETRVLLEREDIGGFNDLFTDASGRVYVGSLRSDPFRAGGTRTPGELWRIDPGGRAVALYGEVSLSNGIGFSPDGERLYHADTAAQQVIAHRVTAAGELSGREVFAKLDGFPDGLAVDVEGCVWVALYGGGCVARLGSDGKPERRVSVPAQNVTSLCFGGRDLQDLYVVTADHLEQPERRGSVFRTRSPVPGLAAPPARV